MSETCNTINTLYTSCLTGRQILLLPPPPVSSGYCAPPRAYKLWVQPERVSMKEILCFQCRRQLVLRAADSSCAVLIKLSSSFPALPCHVFLFSRELTWLVGAPFTVPPTVCNPITGLWDKLPPPAAFQSREDMKKMLVDKLCFDSRRMPSSFSLDSSVSLPNFCQHPQSNI